MNKQNSIEMREQTIVNLISKNSLSEENLELISGNLARILTEFFTTLEKGNNMRSWSVDDLMPDTNSQSEKKVTIQGKVWWLSGGGKCVNYQVDIAKNTKPLLYSYKLHDKHGKQLIYIGKTHKEWIINA